MKVCFLIIQLLLVIVSSTDLDKGKLNKEVVYRKSIFIESLLVGEILIFDGQEPADAVYEFDIKHKLGYDNRVKLLNEVCQKLKCTRSKALLWSTAVVKNSSNSDEEEFVGVFHLYEEEEAADAAHDFIKAHNLTIGYRNKILQKVCTVVECTRIEPVIWTKEVNIDGNIATVSVKEGEEPADVIYEQLKPYKLSFESRVRIFDEVKKDGIAFNREFAQIFSKDIVHINGTIAGKLNFYDDGSEPIDVLFEFTSQHNLTDSFDQLKSTVLSQICDLSTCHRMDPVIWKKNLVNESGSHLGTLEILMNNEPVDIVDEFVRRHSLEQSYRDNVLDTVCKDIECMRIVPVIYRKDVHDESGKIIGTLEVFENEEVADAVVRFGRKLGQHIDVTALKKYFLSEACATTRIKCTRDYAVLYDRDIKKDNGSLVGRLIITEYDEPADTIYEWCEKYGLSEDYFYNLVSTVCHTDRILCNRDAPLIFGPQKISGPEGEYVGDYEVQLRQEPVDALYRFFAKYGLFEKNWDMVAVLNQVCLFPALVGKCNRRKAIKYFHNNFTLGDTHVGPLLIWEDEEVIDKIYELSKKFNLTLDDQMTAFTELCKKDEIYCGRTRAVLLKLDDINKSDFEHFGNETCLRYYAGWQFMASISQTTIGGKLSTFVAKDRIKEAIENPLIGLAMLLLNFGLTSLVLRRSKYKKLHFSQRVLFYIYSFLVVGYLNQRFIRPIDDVDKAMYVNEGKLPDLIIYEGEEPADALLVWGKEAARKHHPLVRKKGYWELLEKICKVISCTRKRAWEKIDMGSITQFGQEHKIIYFNPGVDPIARKSCVPILDEKANSCMKTSAMEVCSRLHPKIPNCENDITMHIASELNKFEEKRLDSKNTYTKLGLEMDAPTAELFENAAFLVRKYGQNISPLARIDNGTSAVYEKWDKNTNYAYAVRDAFHKVRDSESREWNDKPCTPYFGGSLCAKTDKSGNMIIEC